MGENAAEKTLRTEIRAVVHGDPAQDTTRKQLIARAAKLGLSRLVPTNWSTDGSLKEPREQRDTANDVFAALSAAVADAYGDRYEYWYVWVKDWYGAGTDENPYKVIYCAGEDIYAAEFSYDEENKVVLGEPVKVRPVTTYVERQGRPLLEWRKKKAEELRGKGLERRSFPASEMELREQDDGSLLLVGYASVTDTAYDVGFYTETIKRGAFRRTLGENPDVQLLINHEGLPLARTRSGTLRLSEDDRGLRVEADLDPDDPDVQSLVRKMRRGDIDQMSFAFQATGQEWNDDYSARTITGLSIHRGDVSVVNQGANPAALASVRSQAAIDALRGIGADGFVNAWIEWRNHTLLPLDQRAGKTLSSSTMEVLSQVLNLIASDAVDEAQPLLAELMGVPNPDAEQDEDARIAEPQRSWVAPDYVTRARQELDLLDLTGGRR
jgi:HK97 family phage prohead protease